MLRSAMSFVLLALFAATICAQVDESSYVEISAEADLADIKDSTISVATSYPFVLEDKHLARILAASKLNMLDISSSKLTASGVRRLGGLKSLRQLEIKSEFKEAAPLEALGYCTSLTFLTVQGIDGVSLDWVGYLADLQELKYLSIGAKKTACGKFPEFVRKLKALEQLELRGECKWPEKGWATFEAHPTLTKLTLFDCPPNAAFLKALATLPKLTELTINAAPYDTAGGVFDDSGVVLLASIKGLKRLWLQKVQITGKNFGLLKDCALETIELWNCALVGDEVFASAAAFANLTTVDLNGCPGVSDKGLGALVDAPALKTLKLFNMPGVTMRSVGYIELASNIRVDFDADVGARHPRKGAAPLVTCKKLVSIITEAQISACDAEADGAWMDFSPSVDSLKALLNSRKIVWIQFVDASDEQLALLAKCAGLLGVVAVRSPRVTDAGIAAMAASKSLRQLHVECGSKLTDVSLNAFKKHPTLQSISLIPVKADQTRESATTISDAGLATLSSAGQLRRVCLTLGEAVTDAGIAALAKAKNLEYVSFYGGSKLTDQSAKTLASLKGLLHCIFFRATGFTSAALECFNGHKAICELAFYTCEGVPVAAMKAFYAANAGVVLRGGKPRDGIGRDY